MKVLRNTSIALLFAAALPLSAATFTANSPRTTNNDDSCDISLLPAATLLLPYFEVDVNSAAGTGETTILTVTNTSHLPQAARVTLWTDFGYPVMNFNIYMTGYDVVSLNLFDVIRRGQIAPDDGTGSDVSHVGELSGTNSETEFDNTLLNEASCHDLPVQLPQVYITRMMQSFTTGKVPAAGSAFPGCDNIGTSHTNAIGYVTLDVVGSCGITFPTDTGYFTSDIRYDNVLVGDYIQVNGAQDYAQVNTMVHIRAVPEGGESAAPVNNLPRSFYSRYQTGSSTTSDRRQPLPATFAGRWIAGGPANFDTVYKIWREGKSGATVACAEFAGNNMTTREIVRFDEEENPEALAIGNRPSIPSASLQNVDDDIFPPATGGAVGGWMYFNLDDATADSIARQGWVVVSMRSEGRFSGDMDAQALGNGCSAPRADSNAIGGATPIGPAPNTTP